MPSCSSGDASRMEARPSPTRNIITGKPNVTPAAWGRVRASPKREPEDASIALLGPGVKAMTVEKIRTAMSVWSICTQASCAAVRSDGVTCWLFVHIAYFQ